MWPELGSLAVQDWTSLVDVARQWQVLSYVPSSWSQQGDAGLSPGAVCGDSRALGCELSLCHCFWVPFVAGYLRCFFFLIEV